MSLFNVNAKNVRLHKFLPKHGKAEDAARSAELQFRNVQILPAAAAAVLLAEQHGGEVESAFFTGDPPVQRFFGIDEVVSTAKFSARHMMSIDELGEMRVELVDKIKIRLEGGPQRLIWADFSVHLEDPSAEEVDYFHEMINRDVALQLTQDRDMVDEMRAEAQNMSVSTTVVNGELELDQQQRDDAQLEQAADELAKPKRGRKAAPSEGAAVH